MIQVSFVYADKWHECEMLPLKGSVVAEVSKSTNEQKILGLVEQTLKRLQLQYSFVQVWHAES